jgi:hypothetical protein
VPTSSAMMDGRWTESRNSVILSDLFVLFDIYYVGGSLLGFFFSLLRSRLCLLIVQFKDPHLEITYT